MNLYDELVWRGLIKDVTSENLKNILNGEPISFYWGTDPTAPSLHLGHYSSLVTAKRLALAGHKPFLLVGGATGLIGDPRPTAEREIISKEALAKNLEGIKKQVNDILKGKASVINNYDWIGKIDFIDFLREVGKYINVNYMLDKDIIRRRLETGITFAEFSYTLIQGYDFYYLFENKNCVMQVAGSDQWGNLTTGIDLIRKKTGKEACGFTMPLILDSNGKKFGKSEGNALWLNKDMTSSYELYQYLVNTDDSMIEHYLKVFTFLTPDEIMDIVNKHNEHPELRLGQKTLAREIITDLHGAEEYEKAVNISEALFNGNVSKLKVDEILNCLKDVPSFEIGEDILLVDLLVNYNICSSKREAREFLKQGSILVNDEKITDENTLITRKNSIDGKLLVIRRGKKKYFLGKFI